MVTAAPFRAALGLGLGAGFVELALVVARAEMFSNGLYRKSRHVIWMVPVANVALFAVCGLCLAVLARWFPRVGRPLSVYALAALAFLVSILGIPGLKVLSGLLLAVGLAAWTVPWIKARAETWRGPARWGIRGMAALLLGLVGLAFGREQLAEWKAASGRPSAPVGAPNVLLVVMDTVRADATSLNGSPRDTTPNLAALARRGVRFERAIAPAPWTLPSHASMFTGRSVGELEVGPNTPLDARDPTLAEVLSRRGYATAGFVANTLFCGAEYGLARGFGHYEDYVVSPLAVLRSSALGWLICQRLGTLLDRACLALGLEPRHPLEVPDERKDAARINRDFLRWVVRQDGRPFFAFLNYMDAHDPYLVPGGARRRFGLRPRSLSEFRLLREWSTPAPQQRTPRDLTLARDAYDDCIASLDSRLGELFAALDRLGVLEETVVIVTSDHGEHFGEHELDGRRLFGHRASLYQPEVHVPLLIVAPDDVPAGAVVRRPVSLRDLPATVVDLLGLEGGAAFPGTSLAEAWRSVERGTGTPPSDVVLSEFIPRTDPASAKVYGAVIPKAWRALVGDDSRVYHRIGDAREELYDLDADPGEACDVSDARESLGLLERFRTTLEEVVATEGRGRRDPR